MTRQIPSYLRLHKADDNTPKPRRLAQHDHVQQFWRHFAETTGWVAERTNSEQSLRLRSNIGVATMLTADELADAPTVPYEAAFELAKSAAAVSSRLLLAEKTIRQQDAKLAAYEASNFATALSRGNDEVLSENDVENNQAEPSLADRVESVLRCGMQAVGCQAVALYLLDDDTSQLKLRSSVGLPTSRLTEPPRQLRGSMADLEALVGGVVTLEDCNSMPEWTSPEPFNAAMCLAVEVSGNPVGTLWFWFEESSVFGDSVQASGKLTSSLVASELTSDFHARRTAKANHAARPIKTAVAWQQRQQPLCDTPAEGWSLAGWIQSPLALASSWYYWDVLPDGMLAFVIAEAHSLGYESAMVAATARSAWQAHCNYRHDPSQMLRRISDTLWQTNSGDQLLSCFYAQLNPETGEGAMASAGYINGLVVGKFGYRPLVDQTNPIGSQIDLRPRLQRLQLEPSESLYVYTPGLLEHQQDESRQQSLNQQKLFDLLREARGSTAADSLAALKRALADLGKPLRDRTVLAASRLAD